MIFFHNMFLLRGLIPNHLYIFFIGIIFLFSSKKQQRLFCLPHILYTIFLQILLFLVTHWRILLFLFVLKPFWYTFCTKCFVQIKIICLCFIPREYYLKRVNNKNNIILPLTLIPTTNHNPNPKSLTLKCSKK